MLYSSFSWHERRKEVLQRLLKNILRVFTFELQRILNLLGFGKSWSIWTYYSCSNSIFIWHHLVSNCGRDHDIGLLWVGHLIKTRGITGGLWVFIFRTSIGSQCSVNRLSGNHTFHGEREGKASHWKKQTGILRSLRKFYLKCTWAIKDVSSR